MGMRSWPRVATLLCAVLALAGCTFSDYLATDPIVSVQDQPARPQQRVYYATDRMLGADYGFDRHWGASLHCGAMTFDIPAGKKAVIADPASPPTATPCSLGTDLDAFIDKVAQGASTAPVDPNCDSLLVVVHGYNTIFSRAMQRTAQVAVDTGWACRVLLFSWSSEGQFNRYAADVERSGYAVPQLITLLRRVRELYPNMKISILAHSMGNRLMLTTLAALCPMPMTSESGPVSFDVDQLVLAAPDVGAEKGDDDFGKFLLYAEKDNVRPLVDCVRRTTIYASQNDMALLTSESIHGGVRRAGRVPLADIDYQRLDGLYGEVDVIDASTAMAGSVGHSYFSVSPEVVQDIGAVLQGVAANDRKGLLCTDYSDARRWTCPKPGAPSQGRLTMDIPAEHRTEWSVRMARRIWPLIFRLE